MSSSAQKKKITSLSPTKKDSLTKDDSNAFSPKPPRSSSKKRRTSELESIPIQENEVQEPSLQIKLLSEHAITPIRKSPLAAGYDLASAHDYVVPATGRVLVQTDLALCVPLGSYGRIASRSGLAVDHGIEVGAGVIDGDYRGPLGVLLFNHSDTDFEVKRGDRIAQLLLERILTPKVEVVKELPETERGSDGFGSTGVATDCTNTHDDA